MGLISFSRKKEMEHSMKLVIDVEDLFWFAKNYNKYYKENNGKRYLDPASLQYAFQKLIAMKGFFIDN